MGCKNCVNENSDNNSELITTNKIPSFFLKNKNSSFDEIKQDILELINLKRKEYGVEPLIENKEISEISQKYAEKISENENLVNSNNQYNGENLGESIFCYSTLLDANGLITRLCKNEKKYDFSHKEEIPSHFTQMIWKNSQSIGIGINRNNNSGHMFYILNYYPSGNISGKYKENINKKRRAS